MLAYQHLLISNKHKDWGWWECHGDHDKKTTIHLERGMNWCTKFHGKPSSCWDISLKAIKGTMNVCTKFNCNPTNSCGDISIFTRLTVRKSAITTPRTLLLDWLIKRQHAENCTCPKCRPSAVPDYDLTTISSFESDRASHTYIQCTHCVLTNCHANN